MTNTVPDKRKTVLSIKINLDSAIITKKFSVNQLLLLIFSHQLRKVIQTLKNTGFTSDIAPILFDSSENNRPNKKTLIQQTHRSKYLFYHLFDDRPTGNCPVCGWVFSRGNTCASCFLPLE